ncbi:MAG: methyltransferase domain-containing protein [Candidatus Omnitrophota bacterium]
MKNKELIIKQKGFLSHEQLTECILFSLVAMIIRLIYVAMITAKYGAGQHSDFLYMHQLAQSLAQGLGFTIDGVWIFNQSPGYPVFVSIFYKIIDAKLMIAFALNIVLGALSVALLYILAIYMFSIFKPAKDSYFGIEESIARCSCALAIIYPDSLLYCAYFAAENLLIPLIILFVIFVIRDWRTEWLAGIFIGAVGVIMAQTKAYTLVLCLFAPLIWKIRGQRVIYRSLIAIITAVVILAPWAYLNYKASGGRIVPFGASFGTTFLDGNNLRASGKPTNLYCLPEKVEIGRDEIELNRLRLNKALSYINANPGWFAKLTLKKFLLSFSPVRDYLFQNNNEERLFAPLVSRWVPTIFNTILLFGIIVGIIFTYKKKEIFIVGFCLLLSALLIQLVFFAYPRYRFPFLFALIPFSALGYIMLVSLLRSKPLFKNSNHKKIDFSKYYNSKFSNLLFRWIDWQKITLLKRIISIYKPKIIVELGSGTGLISSKLPAKIFCLELNPELAKLSKKNGIVSCQADLEGRLPLRSSSAEMVFLVDSIEHVQNRDLLFDELKRILKPQGLLIIFTPPYDSLRWIFAEKIHFALLRNPAGHASPYTEESLRYFLSKGFEQIDIRRLNFNLTMCAMARKTV